MKKLLFTLALLASSTSYSQDTWKFKADKQLHLLAGAGVGYILGDVIYNSDRFEKWEAVVLPAFTVIIVAAGKETYDLYSPNNTASLQDFYYTIFGGVIGSFASYGVNKLIDNRNKKRKRIKI